jgi:hypothetical protein
LPEKDSLFLSRSAFTIFYYRRIQQVASIILSILATIIDILWLWLKFGSILLTMSWETVNKDYWNCTPPLFMNKIRIFGTKCFNSTKRRSWANFRKFQYTIGIPPTIKTETICWSQYNWRVPNSTRIRKWMLWIGCSTLFGVIIHGR